MIARKLIKVPVVLMHDDNIFLILYSKCFSITMITILFADMSSEDEKCDFF